MGAGSAIWRNTAALRCYLHCLLLPPPPAVLHHRLRPPPPACSQLAPRRFPHRHGRGGGGRAGTASRLQLLGLVSGECRHRRGRPGLWAHTTQSMRQGRQAGRQVQPAAGPICPTCRRRPLLARLAQGRGPAAAHPAVRLQHLHVIPAGSAARGARGRAAQHLPRDGCRHPWWVLVGRCCTCMLGLGLGQGWPVVRVWRLGFKGGAGAATYAVC